jgi:hypothetical protein
MAEITPTNRRINMDVKPPAPKVSNRIPADKNDAHQEKSKKINYKKIRKHLKLEYVLILVIILALGGWWIFKINSNPIPGNIRKSLNFSVYYPDQMPQGFKIDKTSFQYNNGLMTFVIRNGNQYITISEQKEPNPAPDLNSLAFNSNSPSNFNGTGSSNSNTQAEFVSVPTTIGTAVQSTVAGQPPTIIVSTKTTLINMNGPLNVPSSQLLDVLNQLKKV